MAAFRFLALLTVGFVLLMFVFLLHAGQSRLEIEAARSLQGPELPLEVGASAVWTVRLGGIKVDEAWPGPQRQPRLFVSGAGGATLLATAAYLDQGGEPLLDAFVAGGAQSGVTAEDGEQEIAFGPLWMSWEHPLEITVEVVALAEGTDGAVARPVLRGKATTNYIAARAMARTLWLVFTIIGVAGFGVLMFTLRGRVEG